MVNPHQLLTWLDQECLWDWWGISLNQFVRVLIERGLTEEENPTLNIDGAILWAGSPEGIKWRKEISFLHISRLKQARICMYIYMHIHTKWKGDVCLKIGSESNGKQKQGRDNSWR